MTFHELITRCTEQGPERGTLFKQAWVDSCVANEDIKELFRLMLCPSIVYNIKKVPDYNPLNPRKVNTVDYDLIYDISLLLERDLRGKVLSDAVKYMDIVSTKELRQVLSWVLDRKNPAAIGKSIVNKTWPGLIRTQVYMGAVSGTQEHLERLPWDTGVNVQVKEDGMSVLVDYVEGKPQSIRTRQGNRIDQYIPKFFSRLPEVPYLTGIVHHELLVYDSEEQKYLDRQTGNGLINKAVKNGQPQPHVDNCIHSVILDIYTDDPQGERYNLLAEFVTPWSRRVLQATFYELSTARMYTQELIRGGAEGTVCKDPTKPFKDGKPWYCVKIKNEFEVELRVIGWKPHSKHSSKMGSLLCVSEDGILECSVGSGFSDVERCIDPTVYDSEIITVRANEVIKNKGSKKPSLYLPRFIEVRPEKTKADTYKQIKEQEEASKGV